MYAVRRICGDALGRFMYMYVAVDIGDKAYPHIQRSTDAQHMCASICVYARKLAQVQISSVCAFPAPPTTKRNLLSVFAAGRAFCISCGFHRGCTGGKGASLPLGARAALRSSVQNVCAVTD